MDKKAVFDFDKTLVQLNSFRYWVAFLWKESLLNLDFKIFSKVSILVFHRKILKNISHQFFKKELMLLKIPSDYTLKFSKKLFQSIHLEINNRLLQLSSGEYKIAISSAAPQNYLSLFFHQNYPNHRFLIIGSEVENGLLNDNFKNQKLENLINKGFLKRGDEIDVLFTDSEDDYPLATISDKIVLVAPNEQTRKIYVSEFKSKLEIIEKK